MQSFSPRRRRRRRLEFITNLTLNLAVINRTVIKRLLCEINQLTKLVAFFLFSFGVSVLMVYEYLM